MFGASIVRQKREKERKERLARGDPPIIPFIKPFPARFDPKELPYFKYRESLAVLERESGEDKVMTDILTSNQPRQSRREILMMICI